MHSDPFHLSHNPEDDEQPHDEESGENRSFQETEYQEEHDAEPEWKSVLREQFETWLNGLDDCPEEMEVVQSDLSDSLTPDLSSFYQELASLNSEFRKSNRRVAETFSQWTDVLGQFERDLAKLREQASKENEASRDRLPHDHCLALIEVMDRIERSIAGFRETPRRSWWQNDSAWLQQWNIQRKAVEILRDHLEDLLGREGLARFSCLNQTFDPAAMSAVETETDPSKPHQTVTAEFLPGYRRGNNLLRFAHVKVNIHTSNTP